MKCMLPLFVIHSRQSCMPVCVCVCLFCVSLMCLDVQFAVSCWICICCLFTLYVPLHLFWLCIFGIKIFNFNRCISLSAFSNSKSCCTKYLTWLSLSSEYLASTTSFLNDWYNKARNNAKDSNTQQTKHLCNEDAVYDQKKIKNHQNSKKNTNRKSTHKSKTNT